jgi:two-component system, chemotaxis family, protein-glutamate methylesterase/glutaminase
MDDLIVHSAHPRSQRNIVVVGASAGGVEALSTFVAGLPPEFPAAVFVVMHIPAHTPSALHQILERAGRLPAVQAVDGEPIRKGHIYVAPSDRHLMIDGDRIRLTRGPKENRSRPSINVLFRSAAYSFGPRVIGVVLTGMLDDGTAGLWAIKDRGGLAMVQLPEDAPFPSMPQSALDNVEIDVVLPIAEMPAILVERTSEWIMIQDEPSVSKIMEVEHHDALGDNRVQGDGMELGSPSPFTCPECHGTMVQIEEGTIIRFRCHTGHVYSLRTLLTEINEAIDDSLWNTIRVIEERIFLLRQMGQVAKHEAEAEQCLEEARRAEELAEQLRELVSHLNEQGSDRVTR